MPQLTVVLPVRDGAQFLDAAIESVVAGAFTDLELIAVDDGSVDATPAILDRWARRDARISVVTLDRPHGAASARNRGLEAARGEFVVPFDHDDLFVPARVRPQIEALRADPDAVLVAGGADVVDARGRRLFTRSLPASPDVIAHVLVFGNPISHGTVMVRRDALRAAGGYDEALLASDDYDLWLRLAQHGRILAIPMVCLRYRQHDAQMTARSRVPQRAESFENTRRALVAALGREPVPGESHAVATVWRETGELCDLDAADRVFREALGRSPHAGDPEFRRNIETLTAERWTAQASRLALAGHPVAALSCMRRARRWHPRGAVGAASLAAHRIAWLGAVGYRTRIRARQDSNLRPSAPEADALSTELRARGDEA